MPLDHDSAVGHSFGLEFEGVNIALMDVVGLVLSVFGLGRPSDPTPAGDRHPGPRADLGPALRPVGPGGPRRADRATLARRATIVVFAHDGSPVARYHLENAWPSKLEIGTLKASDTSVVAERLTLTFDRVEVE